MANLKNLSERIKSVTSIQQVTKAMKMVAAAKVKKAQDKMEISRPYSKNTQELICRILPQISSTDISLVEKGKSKKKLKKLEKIKCIYFVLEKNHQNIFQKEILMLKKHFLIFGKI